MFRDLGRPVFGASPQYFRQDQRITASHVHTRRRSLTLASCSALGYHHSRLRERKVRVTGWLTQEVFKQISRRVNILRHLIQITPKSRLDFCQRLNTLGAQNLLETTTMFPQGYFLKIGLKSAPCRMHRLGNISPKTSPFATMSTFSHD